MGFHSTKIKLHDSKRYQIPERVVSAPSKIDSTNAAS